MTFHNTQLAANAARLEACAQVVSTFLDEQLEALHNGARHPLLVAARDAAERDEEDRLLSVMEEVDALCPLATESFRDGLLTKLRAPGGGLSPAPAEGSGGLDLWRRRSWMTGCACGACWAGTRMRHGPLKPMFGSVWRSLRERQHILMTAP